MRWMRGLPGRKQLMDLLQDTISRLGEDLLSSLETLAMPHWIDRRIASRDKLPEMRESQVLQELGLIQSLSGGQVRVAPPVRQYLVDRLARDQRPRYGELSRRCYDLFSAVEKPPVELYIEAQYHRLAVDERGAAAQLFRDAMQVHSEPVFAFETLRRLLRAWREQETRGVLSDVGTSYPPYLLSHDVEKQNVERGRERDGGGQGEHPGHHQVGTVAICRPEPLAAVVPATPEDGTWVVETGRP
jgi:hypothetical protein